MASACCGFGDLPSRTVTVSNLSIPEGRTTTQVWNDASLQPVYSMLLAGGDTRLKRYLCGMDMLHWFSAQPSFRVHTRKHPITRPLKVRDAASMKVITTPSVVSTVSSADGRGQDDDFDGRLDDDDTPMSSSTTRDGSRATNSVDDATNILLEASAAAAVGASPSRMASINDWGPHGEPPLATESTRMTIDRHDAVRALELEGGCGAAMDTDAAERLLEKVLGTATEINFFEFSCLWLHVAKE